VRFVAIHGLGCAASQGWPRVAAALAPEHELVALRIEGADGETTAPSGAWGILAQAARLARDVRPTDVLVGHSMGGTLATRVAERAGGVRALVLVEPHVVPRAGFVVRPTLAAGLALTPTAHAAYLSMFEGVDTGEGSYATWLARWDRRVLHRMSEELATGDGGAPTWLDALASFDFPVHVVWGKESDDAGENVHAHALRKLGFPFHVVEGSRHFVPSEAPDALAQTLRSIAASLGS
jgi:pimeloyl-ACP methyl ester carboxylesterase